MRLIGSLSSLTVLRFSSCCCIAYKSSPLSTESCSSTTAVHLSRKFSYSSTPPTTMSSRDSTYAVAYPVAALATV